VETRTAPLIGGRYRIGGLLGKGGMARVFDAFDERLERPVAVKVLRAETRALPGMRQRFQQEALIAARLIHPHIVAVLDFGEDDSASYLVMERLPGSTLRDEIMVRGPLSTGRVALVVAETLTALAAAHGRGVLHRDIKPSNILLQQDGHTKISDFGIAKSFDVRTNVGDDMTMTGIILGTPGYLAPERRSGHPATVQSDVYAVGAVMVEALSGQRLGAEVTPADCLAPPWRDVASRALAPDPRQRFRSASDMLQALRISTTGPSPAPRPPQPPMTTTVRVPRPNGTPPPPSTAASLRPVSPRPSTPSGGRRRRRVALAFVAVLVLAAALFVLLAGHVRPTGPAATIAKHHVADPRTQALTRPTTTPSTADPESAAITSLATSLANGGFPGDGALASALQATAAAPPGAARESAAQQTLSLAAVLLGGGGITSGQYEDVVGVLQPTGATVTTTTTTSPSADPFLVPFSHPHGHGRGDGAGNQG
jgi:eukaryotic-like serine/threonine-protein kinase